MSCRTANLALSLAMNKLAPRPLRVGLLDLDIFGPSIPKLMGLERAGEPDLSRCASLFLPVVPSSSTQLIPVMSDPSRSSPPTNEPRNPLHVHGLSPPSNTFWRAE